MDVVQVEYQQTIVISKEPGTMYQDMFHIDAAPTSIDNSSISIIRSDVHLKELGVDFTKATPDGLIAVYQRGLTKGWEFACLFK